MTFTFTRMHILLFFELAWLFFISITHTILHDSAFFTILSLVSLFAIPGSLTILILRLRALDLWTYVVLALAFSILEIICVALIGNTLLPYFGIERPLQSTVLLSEFSIFIAGLIAISWVQAGKRHLILKRYLFVDTLRDFVLALFPVIFVVLAILGSTLLNNGAGNILTFALLIGSAMYAAILLYVSRETHENVIPTGLFFLSLALLLMTSLRGWYVTGHDIQREYEVFQLTKNSGIWSIAHLRDAYNACLSITILPTVLSALSNVSDPYIFKVIFQLLFATVPTMLFLFVRRYAGATIALITSLYFIAFPTFFTDMPFLNRQEIAFLFLFVMFCVISDERITLFKRRVLFCCFGLGMVLSHYSTTYTVVALLTMGALAHPLISWLGRLLTHVQLFSSTGIAALRKKSYTTSRITLTMALFLALSSFLWSSVLTDTSSNSLYRVVSETFSVILSNAHDDARSSDVLYGLFSWRHVEPAQLLLQYNEKVAAPARALEEAGTYFSDTVLERYPILPAHEALLPLTAIGSALHEKGFDVATFNAVFRASSAKILQLLMLIGLCAVFFSRRYLVRPLDTEFLVLSLGSLCMLIAILVLPVLSVEYGLLRAFQQSLLFLGLFIVLGNCTLLTKAGERIALACSGALVIVFLLSSTGSITQTLGGYEPQLHLNNAGTYYDLYYIQRSEILGTEWLLTEMQLRGVRTYQSGLAVDVVPFIADDLSAGVDVAKNIYPGVIRTRSYVLVGPATLHSGRATVLYNSDVVTYQYPLQFLDDNKDLLYSNGDVAVYR